MYSQDEAPFTPPEKSIFTTPKPSDHSMLHPLSRFCLRKCTQWSLGIQVYNAELQNKSQIVKVPCSGIAMRQVGSLSSGPVSCQKDIIDSLIEQETQNKCSHMPQLPKSLFGQGEQSSDIKLESLSGFISSDIDLAPLKLPLNNSHRQNYCTDILNEGQHLGGGKVTAESLYCLEFNVKQALPLLPDF